MDEKAIERWVRKNINMSFSRSSGPGGQHVNKRDTKVTARIPLTSIDILTKNEKAMIKSNLSQRLNRMGELVISVQDTRSQSTNREIAVKRVTTLIVKTLKRKKKRHPTLPTLISKERRISGKKLLGRKKFLRSKVEFDE